MPNGRPETPFTPPEPSPPPPDTPEATPPPSTPGGPAPDSPRARKPPPSRDDPTKPGRVLVTSTEEVEVYEIRDAQGKWIGRDVVGVPTPQQLADSADRATVGAAVKGWATASPKAKDDALLAALRLILRES